MVRKVKVRNKSTSAIQSSISKKSPKMNLPRKTNESVDVEEMLDSNVISTEDGTAETRSGIKIGERLQRVPPKNNPMTEVNANGKIVSAKPLTTTPSRTPALSRLSRGMSMVARRKSTPSRISNMSLILGLKDSPSTTPARSKPVSDKKPSSQKIRAMTKHESAISASAVEERMKSPDRAKYLLKQLHSTLSPKLTEPSKPIGQSISRYGRIQKQKENSDYIPLDVAKFITKSPPKLKTIKLEVPKLSMEGFTDTNTDTMMSKSAHEILTPTGILDPTTEVIPHVDENAEVPVSTETLDTINDVIAQLNENADILGIDQIKIVDLDASFGDNSIGAEPIPVVKDSVKIMEKSMETDSAKGSSIDLNNSQCEFKVGHIFWGKLRPNNLHWPCMVCPDPEDNQIMKERKMRVAVHVVFFADRGRRSWLTDTNMLPFNSLQHFEAWVHKEYTMTIHEPSGLKREKKKSLKQILQLMSREPWREAVRQAEDMFNYPVEEREQRFKQLLDLELENAQPKQPARMRSKSVSAGYISNSFDDTFESARKRRRSPTPESPAYEVLPLPSKNSESLSKRLKLESDDPDLFRSTISRYFQSMAEGSDVLETASGTSSECEEISEMAGFDREVYNDLLNVSRLYVFEGQTETEIDLKLQKYVQKICALRMQPSGNGRNGTNPRISNRLRSQALRNSFLKFEKELGIGQIKKNTSPVPEPSTAKAKKEEKSLEERFIFTLERNYLMKGIPKGYVCAVCLKTNEVIKCSTCHNYFHPGCLSNQPEIESEANDISKNKSFKCSNCIQQKPHECFVCHDQEEKVKDERLHRCAVFNCGKYYHIPCLRLFPQHKLTSTPNSSTLFCSYHTCHTCVSDDPRSNATAFKGRLIRCIRCPSSYHPDASCIPAGSQLLSTTAMICPKHSLEQCSINVTWCFLCGNGGELICCETCPTAFHLECLKFTPPEGRYICEECESGRMPLYNELVWARYGVYRFWPALTVPPPEIPDPVMRRHHAESDICLVFFATHDYGWINRRRIYLYQEGDSDIAAKPDSAKYIDAMQEAKLVYELLQTKKTAEEAGYNQGTFKPPPYVKIKSNKYVPPLKLPFLGKEEEENTKCECKLTDSDPCGPESNCINRALLVQCSSKVCPARQRCQNRFFVKRQYPTLTVKRIPHKGWGLFVQEDIRQGQFVIEYVGEVINNDELERRLQQKQEQKDENYYFLTVDSELTIDAGPKGNLARFINHSCEPNCETMLWRVHGAQAVGLFAIRDIKAGTELTFNYNFESTGDKKKICQCGAPKCSGFIGQKYRPPVKKEVRVELKRRQSVKGTKKIKRRRQTLHMSDLAEKKRKMAFGRDELSQNLDETWSNKLLKTEQRGTTINDTKVAVKTTIQKLDETPTSSNVMLKTEQLDRNIDGTNVAVEKELLDKSTAKDVNQGNAMLSSDGAKTI